MSSFLSCISDAQAKKIISLFLLLEIYNTLGTEALRSCVTETGQSNLV